MSRKGHALRLALVAAIAILAVGCNPFARKLDPTSSAESIKSQMNAQLIGANFTVTSVTCPDDIEAKAGVTFTCSAQLSNGNSVQIKGTQVDDNGKFNAELVGPPLNQDGTTGTTGATPG